MRKALWPKIQRVALSLVLAVTLLLALTLPVAANGTQTVTITMSAEVVSITNSETTWNIGALTPGHAAVYFSEFGDQDDNYSQIENTGNVAVNISIQGTNATDTTTGTYNWTLVSSPAGNQTFSLYANSGNGSATYDIGVNASAPYNDLVTDLAKDGTYVWSMNLTPPTAFHPDDDGNDKVCTVVLVASKA